MKRSLMAVIAMACLLAGCNSVPPPMDDAVATVPVAAKDKTPAAPDLLKTTVEGTAAMGEAPANGSCDVNATVQQCCSAAGCSGKVLSNRDAHNCKRTAGKSWHAAARGGQPASCQRM